MFYISNRLQRPMQQY